MSEQVTSPPESSQRRWLAGGLVLLMMGAPLFRAGQPPLALMGIELTALVLLLAALWRPPSVSRAEVVAAVLFGGFALPYLIPMPLGLIADLPGRAPYVDIWRTAFGEEGLPGSATISLVPHATEGAWLVMLVPVAVFFSVRSLRSRQLPMLVHVLIAIASLQVILGLMQFGSGSDSLLYLGMKDTHFGSAVGSYTNRNHLAGLIEMTLPISLALLFFNAGMGREERRSLRGSVAFLGSRRGQWAMVYAVVVVLLLVGVIFTRSRMGISMTMLGILLSVALFGRRIGGDNTYGPVGTVVAVALGLAVTIGLVPVLDRFSVEGVTGDLRWIVFGDTLKGIGSFFPVGAGPGTFQDVFPAFQSLELGRFFVNRAHSDYLDWLFEGGAPAALLIVWLLVLYVVRWRRVLAPGGWSRLMFIQVGAGIGILLVLLHELVDYNLHIPANIVYFALLVGVFFSDLGTASRRRGPRLGASEPDDESDALLVAPRAPAKPPPDQIRNPFLDG